MDGQDGLTNGVSPPLFMNAMYAPASMVWYA